MVTFYGTNYLFLILVDDKKTTLISLKTIANQLIRNNNEADSLGGTLNTSTT